MTNVSVWLLFSLALFLSLARSIPVDVADPPRVGPDPSRDINEPIIPIDKIFPGIDAINLSPLSTNSTIISLAPTDVSSSQGTELTSSSSVPSSSTLPKKELSTPSSSTASSSTVSSSTVSSSTESSSTVSSSTVSSSTESSSTVSSSTVSSSTVPNISNPTTEISTSTKVSETLSKSSEISLKAPELQSPLSSPLPISSTSSKTPVTSTPIPPIIVKSPRTKSQRKPNNSSNKRQNNSTRGKPSTKRPDGQRPTNTPFRGRTPGYREQNVPKNSCDLCTKSCKKNKPICSKPLGIEEVDPDKLRGFPSTCHMDCFNICRKIRYEKVTDGRCGRLKNRIRPVDSKNKLTRIELNKTQYKVDTEEDPIFVFSPYDE